MSTLWQTNLVNLSNVKSFSIPQSVPYRRVANGSQVVRDTIEKFEAWDH